MLRCLLMLCAAPLFAPVTAQEVPPGAPPVMTVQGQEFFTWDEYKQSDLFRDAGLHCQTDHPESAAYATADPSDCTYNFTNPSQEYAPTTIIEIPVVMHCLFASDGTGFVPEAAIVSQVQQLNERFRAFAGGVGGLGNDTMIQFHLATEDEFGNPSTGIEYRQNDQFFNDGGQYWNSLSWDTNRYLNIYTNNAAGFLGYVPFLPQQGGGVAGNPADRVVLLWSTVGASAPIGFPYDQGTIAAHEVGHYLGLFHTFQGGCGHPAGCATQGDRICDTNPSSSAAFVCNPINSCGMPDPFENYMSYGDPCMTEFSPEQILRMRCSIEHYRPDLGLTEPAGTWVDLGGGTSGSNGSPTFEGGGLLLAGSVATIDLQSAPPNGALLLWVSLTSTPLNVLGGTIHAVPFAAQIPFFADGSGDFSAFTTWPDDVPPGTQSWFQFLVQDATVPGGITLSNGVKATAP